MIPFPYGASFLRVAPLLVLTLALAACAGRGGPGAGTEEGVRGEDRGDGPPVGLHVVEQLEFPPLRFEPMEPEQFELSNGVTVFYMRNRSIPLVDLFVSVKGGYAYFDREHFGAASALPSLLRNGGTRTLSPDSLDELMAFHALGLSTSSNGSRLMLAMTGLNRQLDLVADLWGDILLNPGFDEDALERWRLQELESVRRAGDFPGSLAVIEFNHLVFGDHPTGWIMEEEDLTPERMQPERLAMLHQRIVCPESSVIGAAGDISREDLTAALERALAGWEPCDTELEPPPLPDMQMDPTVYVVPKQVGQSTIAIGQPGGVLLEESEDYFASRVANWVIGGSGFTSRLVSRLRTEEGLAYSAASIWGVARNYPRIFGAITHTKSESTVAATRMTVATLADAVANPPTSDEVALARDAIINGFVFGFNSPTQVVARQVSYLADGFPSDWLARYLDGIRDVDSTTVAAALRRHVDPENFTILIVGDTAAFDPEELGPTVYLPAR